MKPDDVSAAAWERFWSKVDKSGSCWEWTGTRQHNGYGRFWYEGRMMQAHRFAYAGEHGSIPDGLCVCHTCDKPSCVRPAHLWPGTRADNLADMTAKGRRGVNGLRGENHPRAKLVRAQVDAILKQGACGDSSATIARRYGVHKSTVCNILNGTRWQPNTPHRKADDGK